jgi:hypothetical protein
VVADPSDIADRLTAIAEELADLAIERLRRASDALRSGEEPDPGLVAEEKRVTRARRSVERAAALLAVPGAGEPDHES